MNAIFFISSALGRKRRGYGEYKNGVKESKIALFSVAISTILILSAISISDGFKREIGNRAVIFSGEISINSGTIDNVNNQDSISFKRETLEDIAKVENLRSVQGVIYRSAVLKKDSEIGGVILKGVGSDFDSLSFKSVLIEGRLPRTSIDSSVREITLSRRVAKELNINLGESTLLYFINSSVKLRKVKIVGIYDARFEEVDKSFVLTDINLLRELNGWSDNSYTTLEIFLKEKRSHTQTITQIEDILYSAPYGKIYNVKSVSSIYPNIFEWMGLLDYNVAVVLILMFVVAGFNMISSLLITLLQRVSFIGVLKAIGMRNREIHAIFLIHYWKIVLKGLLIGNIAAVAILLLQQQFKIITLDPANYFVNFIPISIDIKKFLEVDLLTLLILTLFLYTPLYFISQIKPSESVKVK